MKPGSLLRVRKTIGTNAAVIYTDDQCQFWKTHMRNDDFAILLGEHQNKWGLDVLSVLFPWGIRWVYRLDVEVVE